MGYYLKNVMGSQKKKINFQKNSKTETKITLKTIIFLTIFLLIFMYNFSFENSVLLFKKIAHLM